MAEVPITIHSTCATTPNQHQHVSGNDKVRWHADHDGIYVLNIPGGFFLNQPNDFQILVVSGIWTKNYVVAGAAGSTVTNYIYDVSGKNCLSSSSSDGPPDIIIDSTGLKKNKKPKKPVARKKAAPKKK